ncbi:MAG: LON peptidase substrate-binding domain-containing protein [Candidatus Poseidoniales archaeon]|jgi:hypothetical protein|tara:strand:+ start:2898 stop:3665 length:768 start_codon:yes stop_codon:yes gene_type:complete
MDQVSAEDNLSPLQEQLIIPLFVLDSLLMPGDSMMMRVFEPRYKQMLDDIVMETLPYGHVVENSSAPQIKGWAIPFDVGTLVEVDDLQENGSNLLYSATGRNRFRIISIIKPELENSDFESIFPSVYDLEKKYSENAPNGKLYLRAIIEIMPELKGVVNDNKWNNLISLWETYIMQIAEITGVNENNSRLATELRETFKQQNEENAWRLASMVIDTIEDQVTCLKSENIKEVVDIIESSIQQKMNMIKFFRESNE